MAQFILKNLTNGPQRVGSVKVLARATSDPIELTDADAQHIQRTGLFRVQRADAAPDPFDALSDDEVRSAYTSVTGKKPGKMGRAKMIDALSA